MLVVWSRLGFLGVLIPIILSVIALMITDGMYGKNHFSPNTVFGVCFILSSPVIWFFGKKLNAGGERKLIDPKTNETVVIKEKHTIFWMPLEYFSIPVILLGIFWLYA